MSYSQLYLDQVIDLAAWFRRRIPEIEVPAVTREMMNAGVDALGESVKRLCDEAHAEWLRERNYDLSYNQVCKAFFVAKQTVDMKCPH